MELDEFWHSIKPDGQLPSREDIDPIDLGAKLMPWVFIVDVVRESDELDYRYRIAGTRNVELVGRDPTGRLASEIFQSDHHRYMLDTFNVTVLSAEPTYWQGEVPKDNYEIVRVYRGLFPLAADGVHVDKLIGIAVARND